MEQLTTAMVAGLWSVVTGRDIFPTWTRNLITVVIAVTMAYLIVGYSWWIIWFAAIPSFALTRDFPDGTCESLRKNVEHWGVPAVMLIGPFIADNPYGCVLYFMANMLTAFIYWYISYEDEKIKNNTAIAYCTEFCAGASCIGALMFIN